MQRGKVNLQKTGLKFKAILQLRQAVEPETPEQNLWFAILERAILDLHRKDMFSSNWFFSNPDNLTAISSALGTWPSVILRILTKCEIWPSQEVGKPKLNYGHRNRKEAVQ